MEQVLTYLSLFATAFIAATIFPISSEALLAYDITQGHNIAALLLVATTGNTLGACVNFYLGYKSKSYLEAKNLIKPNHFSMAQKIFSQYGSFALLFSWLPFFGDILTFAAGILRYRFSIFVALVALAKFGRYYAIVLLMQ